MILTSDRLDERRFTQAQCDAFFAAVLINDVVDAKTELPSAVQLDYSQQQFIECFRLCHQVWKQSGQKEALTDLTRKFIRDRDLSSEDRTRFKYIRAKFKQLRYAHTLYGASHRPPFILNRMTVALGKLQDAHKSGRIGAILFRAAICRFFLTAPLQYLLDRATDHVEIVSPDAFRLYVVCEMEKLRTVLRQDAVTGEQFHETRKIIGRQVSFFDTLRTIYPSSDAYLMSRSLAAINGRMGALHDELVQRDMKGEQDYHLERFALPDDIARPLNELVARYPQ